MTIVGRVLESPRAVAAIRRLRAVGWVARGARLEAGCKVGSGVVITMPWRLRAGPRTEFERMAFLKIVREDAVLSFGESCFVGFGTEINAAMSVTIGNKVLIAPNCFITDHNHNFVRDTPVARQGCSHAAVHIGDDVWLGAGVVVLPGVTIHRGAVVGAGAVVTADVPRDCIVAGVPARVVRER